MRTNGPSRSSLLVLLSVASLVASSAWARSPRHEVLRWKLAERWWLAVPVAAQVAAGWFDGVRSLRVSGLAIDLEAAVSPEVRYLKDRFRARLTARHRRRETVGAAVPQATTLGRLDVTGRPARPITLEARGGVRLVQRTGWPDQYQPVLDDAGEPSGDLAVTDRYGFLDLDGRLGLRWQAARAFAVSARGALQERTYTHDPGYDDLLRPTHLVPGDRLRVRGSATADGRAGPWRGRLGVDVDWLAYRFQFARDAGTGLTHSPPGGDPANPLQRFVRLSILHGSRVSLPWRGVVLAAGVGYARNQDLFDGYYSWHALESRAGVGVRPIGHLRVDVDWRGVFRWYGAAGYQAGPTHPALDDGTRRSEARNEVRARVAYGLWRKRVTPFVEASWVHRSTNFPDYVTWANPPGAPYALDFDYDNAAVRAGVEVEL